MIFKLGTTIVFTLPMLMVGATFPELTWENWEKVLFVYGPMAIGLTWFAFRLEKTLHEVRSAIRAGFDDNNLEIRRVAHRVHGMQKAMLVEVMAHPSTEPAARDMAERMLTEPDDVPPRKKDAQSM
jgi:hypothetical protein